MPIIFYPNNPKEWQWIRRWLSRYSYAIPTLQLTEVLCYLQCLIPNWLFLHVNCLPQQMLKSHINIPLWQNHVIKLLNWGCVTSFIIQVIMLGNRHKYQISSTTKMGRQINAFYSIWFSVQVNYELFSFYLFWWVKYEFYSTVQPENFQ